MRHAPVILAADIGGTHARFLLATRARGRIVALDEATLSVAARATVESACEAFLSRRPRVKVERACLAVAGPIETDARN